MLSVLFKGKIDPATQNRMKKILSEHLERLGFEGEWMALLLKQTGEVYDGRIKFVNLIKLGELNDHAKFAVRPYGKGSTWRIALYPPKNPNRPQTSRVLDELGRKEKEDAEQLHEEQPEKQPDVCVNHVKSAKITQILSYGLEILLDNNVKGLVRLEDLSPNYDKRILNKYSIGETLSRVVISDNTREPVHCTIHTDGITSTTDSNDVFTGIPDKNGLLSLRGYTYDHHRVYEFVRWFKGWADNYPDGIIPQEDSIQYIDEHLRDKYSAKTISKTGLLRIFTSLCDKKPDSYLKRVLNEDGEIIGYKLSDFIGEEFRREERQKTEIVFRPDEKAKQLLTETVEEVVSKIPDDFQPPVPESTPEPTRNCTCNGGYDPECPDQSHHTPDIDDEQTKKINYNDIMTYITKSLRLTGLLESKKTIDTEISNINAWMEQNKHLEPLKDKWEKLLKDHITKFIKDQG